MTTVLITIIFILSFQSVVLSGVLALRKEEATSNRLLAFMMFLWSLVAIHLSLYYTLIGSEFTGWIPFTRLEILYGLGPSVYVYAKSVTDSNFKLNKKNLVHFLPAIIELIYYRTGFYRKGITEEGMYHDFLIIEQWGGLLYTTVYLIMTIYLLQSHKKWLVDNYSNLLHKTLKWLYVPVVLLTSFWTLWLLIRLIDKYGFNESYRELYYLPMYIILTSIILYIGVQGVFRAKIMTVGFSTKKNDSSLPQSSTQLVDIAEKLCVIMENQKPYLEPDFNMNVLSSITGIASSQISKAINIEFGKNFHQFVNEYRVAYFKTRLAKEDAHNFTLLAHAFESGFASKSTFNHIFKKYTGQTPTQYYKELKKNTSENINSDD